MGSTTPATPSAMGWPTPTATTRPSRCTSRRRMMTGARLTTSPTASGSFEGCEAYTVALPGRFVAELERGQLAVDAAFDGVEFVVGA